MGTVHGVYLKYVGLSALSYAGYSLLTSGGGDGDGDGGRVTVWQLLGYTARGIFRGTGAAASTAGGGYENGQDVSLWRAIPSLILGYSTLLNGAIAVLFKLEVGTWLVGKNRKTGDIPTWSYVVFFPFHFPSMLYTHIHTLTGKQKIEKEGKIFIEVVPYASEVQPGWWVGGCYADKLNKDWSGVIDLTSEFPESTIDRTRSYLCIPTWDGVPAAPDQIEAAANFAVEANRRGGDVLVHCAHGRGRSTTIMTACLVKAGLFPTWEDAFERGIKPQRPCCKLNKRMRQNLTEWQNRYIRTR